MMKRYVAVFAMLFTMIFTAGTAKAFGEFDEQNMVRAFGIVDDGKADSDFVSVSEFTKYIFNIIDYPTASEDEMIDAAHSLGILPVADGNVIYKNQYIDRDTALSMLIGVLGYITDENYNGGFGRGTIAVSQKLDLLDGCDAIEEYVTYKNAAIMLANALDVKVITNVNGEYVKSENTLLEKMGITKSKGFVTGIYGISISGDNIKNKELVSINGQYFHKGNSGAEQYFGRNVEFWYTEDENGNIVILYISLQKNAEDEIELSLNDIEGISQNEITYVKGTSLKKLKIAPKFVSVNNEEVDLNTIFGENGIELKNGTITVLSSEDDAKDIIIIRKYKSGYVTAAFGNAVSCSNGMVTELEDEDEKKIITAYKNGVKTELSDIKQGDVISVFESALYTEIEISNTSFEGTIGAKDAEEVSINGARYKYSYEGVLSSGSTGIFYTDIGGTIVYFKPTSQKEYGYIVRAELNDEMNYKLGILTENSGVVEYKAGSGIRVKYDGKTEQGSEILLHYLLDGGTRLKKQAVRYSADSNGSLLWIEFAAECKAYNDFSEKDIMTMYNQYNDAYYLNGYFGRFKVGVNTHIMKVTKDGAAVDSDQISEFYPVNYLTYNIEVFDVDEWNVPGLIVVVVDKLESVVIPKLANASLAVVESFKTVGHIGYDAEKVVELTVYTKGIKKTYEMYYGENSAWILDMNQSLKTTTAKINSANLENYISPGDIVEIYVDNDTHMVAAIRRRYDIRRDRNTYSYMSGYYMKATANRYYTCSYYPYGKVEGITGNEILIDTTNQYGGEDDFAGRWLFDISDVKYGYRWNSDTEKCEVITLGDIEVGDSIYISNSSKNIVDSFVIID